MPSSNDHRIKAERNRAFLNTLDAVASPEWVAIVAFYTAMHGVERLCACESIHTARHQDRLSYLHRHKQHRAIYRDLSILFDASLIARYGTVNKFNKAFPDDTVEKILVRVHLSRIETYVAEWFRR